MAPSSKDEAQASSEGQVAKGGLAGLGWERALVVAVASLAVSVAGLSSFLGSPFVRTAGGSPSLPRGYGGWQFVGITLFTILSPVAVAASMAFTLRMVKRPQAGASVHHWAACGTLLAAAVVMILGYGPLEGAQLVDCAVLFCYAARPAYVDASGFKSVLGLGVFTLGLWLLALSMRLFLWPMRPLSFGWRGTHGGQCEGADEEAAGPALPLLWLMHRAAAKRETRRRLAALFLLLAIPFLLLVSGMLPNTWERFSRVAPEARPELHSMRYFVNATAGVDGDIKSEKPGSWMVTANWRLTEMVNVKLFPDTVLFYAFLELLVLASALAAEFPGSVGLLLARQLGPAPLGQWLLGASFAVMFVLFTCYWASQHLYEGGKWNAYPLEVAARTAGMDGVMLLGLLLLPASKSSPLFTAAGISWESALSIHIVCGVLFLLAGAVHMLLYFARFCELGYPADILPLNFGFMYPQNPIGGSTPSDNWTVPVLSTVFWPSLIFFGVFPWFRRRNYELFRYAHYFVAVLVPALLWHATNAWPFVLPGALLWCFDRLLRFSGALEAVRVTELVPHEAGSEKITKVAFRWPGQARMHSSGMYVVVNFPQVSQHEWHPFSLSASPLDADANLHIKHMGEGTFTAKLHDFAKRAPEGCRGVVMNIDGPYGSAFDVLEAPRVLLVAGGIGITPMVSALRCAVQEAQAGRPGALTGIRLIWVVRDVKIIQVFARELAVEREGLPFAVDVDIYCSRASEEEAAAGGLIVGRPKLAEQLAKDVDAAGAVMVRACGPPAMVADCAKACAAYRKDVVDWEPWSFVF